LLRKSSSKVTRCADARPKKQLKYLQYSHIVSRERNVLNCCAEVQRGHTEFRPSCDARRRETTGAIAHVDKNFSAASNTNQPTCDTLHQRADPQVLARHSDIANINIEGIMARRTIEQRLAQLEAQKKTLQSRLGKQERARDTRRKVLLGALVLHRLQSDKPDASSVWLRNWLTSELPAFLTRDMDTALLADLMSAPDMAAKAASPIVPSASPVAPNVAHQTA
jgi:hypothetical protein